MLPFGAKAVLNKNVPQIKVCLSIYFLPWLLQNVPSIRSTRSLYGSFGVVRKMEDVNIGYLRTRRVTLNKKVDFISNLFWCIKSLFAKLLWKFKTSNTLWSNFISTKYCKKFNPGVVQWKIGSQIWKFMFKTRDKIEIIIWWKSRSGSVNVWTNNWTKLGPLLQATLRFWVW